MVAILANVQSREGRKPLFGLIQSKTPIEHLGAASFSLDQSAKRTQFELQYSEESKREISQNFKDV